MTTPPTTLLYKSSSSSVRNWTLITDTIFGDYENGGIKIKYQTDRPEDFQFHFEFNHFVDDVFFYAPITPERDYSQQGDAIFFNGSKGYQTDKIRTFQETDEDGRVWTVSTIPFTSFYVNSMGDETRDSEELEMKDLIEKIKLKKMNSQQSQSSEMIDLNKEDEEQEPIFTTLSPTKDVEASSELKRKSRDEVEVDHSKRQRRGHFTIDCLHIICEFLPPQKLGTIMLVCKDWDDLLKTNYYFWYCLYKRMFFEDLNIKRENISEYDFMKAFKTRYSFVLKYSVGSSLSRFLVEQDNLVEKAYRSEESDTAIGLLSKCIASQNVLRRYFDLQRKQVDCSVSSIKFLKDIEDVKEGRNNAKYLITIFLERSVDLTDDDSDDDLLETNFTRHDIGALDNIINQFKRFKKSRNSIVVTNFLKFGTEDEASQKIDFIIISSLGHHISFTADIETRVLDETYLDSGRIKVFGKIAEEKTSQFLFEVLFDGETERSKFNFNHEFTERCLKELGLKDINPRTLLYFITRLVDSDIDPQFFLRIQLGIINYSEFNSTKPYEREGEDAYVQNLSDEEEEEEEGEEELTEEERRFVVESDEEVEEEAPPEEDITILSSGDEMEDDEEEEEQEEPSRGPTRKVIEDDVEEVDVDDDKEEEEEEKVGTFSPTIDLNENSEENDTSTSENTENKEGGTSDKPVELDFDDE
ncbi:hypothetical protein NAEGRDRAFT_47729 [Naegleria gruberi]|uniref:F-box domain-containing protein n=1 Tax=Naegleria gruberi TaxID=5762 RepID=D2V9M1_NAEGR|nr:uncharacterized protein NAEGRDRAFT_47729 [Naegleria gruberi]EFC46488.1 hypothetical protein NAEGRDRAFT_47729 [Naegleria gruberi]|eukprot:XP_002679232.1 hypothetical protein NAEGRDRAFT_47729 [Naegleria gruberi strain NEG-M]